MADLEFFFDPVCPWAWITSRWVDQVRQQRKYDVTWRFISLRMINEEIGYTDGSEPWRTAHAAGSRVSDNTTFFLVDVLSRADLDTDWANGADNEDFDAVLREETDLAFSRTGKGVGTPILTFKPGSPDEGSFFGPVISQIPKGAEALRLWDAIETIATTSGMAELKRSLRSAPVFD